MTIFIFMLKQTQKNNKTNEYKKTKRTMKIKIEKWK